MIFIKRSPFTGLLNSMTVDITREQYTCWRHGVLIQDAMPSLTDSEREFLISGLTYDDWRNAFYTNLP